MPQLLGALLDTVSDGVAVLETTGRILRANAALSEILRIPLDQLVDRTVGDVVEEHPMRVVPWESAEITSPVASDGHRVELVRPDGHITRLRIRVRDTSGEDGKKLIILTVQRERTTNEEALAKERFYHMAPDLFCTASTEGRLVKLNPAWSATLGWSEEEFKRLRIVDFVHPDDHASMTEVMRQLRAGARVARYRNRWACRDGSWRWIEWMIVPVASEGLVYGAGRDVTRTIEADAERQKFVSLVENSREMVAMAANDGTVFYVNPAGRELLGLPDETPSPRLSVLDLIEPTNVTQDPWQTLETRGEWRGEGTVRTLLGTRGPEVEQVLYQVRHQGTGELLCIAAIHRDVSQHKALDRMREQAAVNRLKSEFVTTVSHELRTPLTSIRGSLGLLESGLLGRLSEQTGEMIHIARTNTDRLIRLVNDCLDLDRLESGRMMFAFQAIRPERLVDEAIRAVTSVAEAAGVHLARSVRAGLTAWGDPDRLIQVLVNLVANAIKFSPKSGTVRIEVTADEGEVIFAVSDEGPGIPESELGRIFDKFHQVVDGHAARKDGTGLGLAIARGLVARHGGRMGVESTVGSGSEFWFSVPIQPPDEDTLPPDDEDVVEAPRLLLVRLDPSSHRALDRLFAGAGLRVRAVPSLQHALQEGLEPDLIVIEVGPGAAHGLLVQLELAAGDVELARAPVLLVAGSLGTREPPPTLQVSMLRRGASDAAVLTAVRALVGR